MYFNNDRQIETKFEPYLYHVIDKCLDEKAYHDLESFHRNLLQHTDFSTGSTLSGFSKMEVNYLKHGEKKFYTYNYPIFGKSAYPGSLFYSRIFLDEVSRLFSDTRLNGDVCANFRHTPMSEAEDYIHTDFCSSYFYDKKLSHGVNPFIAAENADNTHESARAITAIYYLNNKNWKPGDGGETAIYSDFEGSALKRLVEPLDNRLLLFEVTPSSYHRFMASPQRDRNAIVITFHADVSDQTTKFGTKPKAHYQYGHE